MCNSKVQIKKVQGSVFSDWFDSSSSIGSTACSAPYGGGTNVIPLNLCETFILIGNLPNKLKIKTKKREIYHYVQPRVVQKGNKKNSLERKFRLVALLDSNCVAVNVYG